LSFTLKERKRHDVPILTFHKIDPSFEYGVTRNTPKQFNQILHFLKKTGYQTISLAQLCDDAFALPEKPIVLTFDDAYDSIYRYAAPLLSEYSYFGTIFVISEYVNCWNHWDVNLGGKRFRHLSWQQLNELRRLGFEIGSHGMSHVDFTHIRKNKLQRELAESKKTIEDRTGQEIRFVSFPFGRYNEEVIDLAMAYGYEKGCSYFRRKYPYDSVREDFILERKAYYLFDTIWNLKAKLQLTPWTFLEALKLRMVNLGSYGTVLLKKSEYQ
jgi:biofilm PGA synthesis lipoprotein PgaB